MLQELLDNPEVTGASIAGSFSEDVEWKQTRYRCLVCLIPEEDGTWSALVLSLPGTGSCGPTKEEALNRVHEAIDGLIESYTEDGTTIPWCVPSAETIPSNAELAWIVVNA
ncbi:MAG: type II toxin-antitoxin system HicB family antitoxin [Planctomycetota bacterium]